MNQVRLIKRTGDISSIVRISLKKNVFLIPKMVASINFYLKKNIYIYIYIYSKNLTFGMFI